MDADLKAYLDTMQKTLTKQIAETRQHAEQLNAETRVHAEQINAATRRELGTLIEAVHDDVKLLAEAVAINNDRMTALLTDHEKRITHLEERRG